MVEDCYAQMGANYTEAIRRIGSDERICKYMAILQQDESMDSLCRAFVGEDRETAFRASHTIKGSALNLGLTRLSDSSSRLTEALRSNMPLADIAPPCSRKRRRRTG